MELLTTAHDDVELSILKAILEDENIPCLTQDRGSGSSVRLITGYSMYGTDILVPAGCLEQAKEILDAYRNAEPVEDWSDSDDGEDEDDE
jgi:hypothetical protein